MNLRFLYILLLLNLNVSCDQKEQTTTDLDAWEETRSSEDYWDYAQFIQTFPESKYFDTALISYLNYRNKLWDSTGIPIVDCFNNCADIRFMNKDGLLFEHEPSHVYSLRHQTLDFMINKNYEPTKPTLKQIVIPETDSTGFISKGHIEFAFVPEKQPDPEFQKAVIQVSRGIQDYKGYLAKRWYRTEYEELSTSRRSTLDSLLAHRMVFWEFSGEPTPPPPPQSEPEVIEKEKK